MTELNDNELLQQYVHTQSEVAFSTLVERYVNLVYSAALRYTGNPHHAQEITQAVFLILARKAESLSSKVILSGWLYETARLTACNFVKGEIRRQNREQEAYMQSALPDSAPAVAWEQMAPLLEEAMGCLGSVDRDALVLHFFENKTVQEVGTRLHLNDAAAHKRVSRALEKLRKFFVKRGVTVSAALIASALGANSIHAAPAGVAAMISVTATNGSVASVTTSTLVKGVLKTMALAKTKAVIVASLAALLVTSGTVGVVEFAILNKAPTQKLPTGKVTPMIGLTFDSSGVILASDGSLWSWGDQDTGWPKLGLKYIENTASLRRIGKETNWSSIGVGSDCVLAIKSDGSLWGWGANSYYQLGDGTETKRNTPVRSVPGNDWKQAVTGNSSFGLKNDGTLWTWGVNRSRQSGLGNPQFFTNAVQFTTSTQWTKIWGGSGQVVGLQSDGSLWFWGALGNEEEKQFPVPTRVSPDTNWADVCFGYSTTFAIKSDGTLWCWGDKARFYTHSADTTVELKPKQVGTEADWKSCSSIQGPGGFYQLLRKKDGSLWAMDAYEYQIHKPDSEYKRPVAFLKVDINKNIVAYTGGGHVGVALTAEGEVWTWGRVLGEHPMRDFWGPNGEHIDPQYKTKKKPWPLSIVDPSK